MFDLEQLEKNINQGALTSEVHVEAESLTKRKQSNANGNSAQQETCRNFPTQQSHQPSMNKQFSHRGTFNYERNFSYMRDVGNSFYALTGDEIQDIPNTRNSRSNDTLYNARNSGIFKNF